MKIKVIYYVICTKQTKTLGIMVEYPSIISLKSRDMMILDSNSKTSPVEKVEIPTSR